MESIQVNAALLTQEGELLSRVQGKGVVDYDSEGGGAAAAERESGWYSTQPPPRSSPPVDEYASRLEDVLERKLAVTGALLTRLRIFRGHLAEEEELSRMRTEAEERQRRHAAAAAREQL